MNDDRMAIVTVKTTDGVLGKYTVKVGEYDLEGNILSLKIHGDGKFTTHIHFPLVNILCYSITLEDK